MELAGETSNEGGGGTASVSNVLLGGGPCSITFWGGDLVLVVGDVPEYVWSTRGLPKADNGVEGKEAEVRELSNRGIREGS